MARLSRLVLAQQPHLVIQRGRGTQPVFIDDADRRAYVEALIAAAGACPVAVHAYALTDHEACLVVTPATAVALGGFMQRVGRRYVPVFNARHGRQGPLWAGRFQAAAIDPEHHVLASIRFVEQAPVRCGAVMQASEWPWSSAGHHTGRQAAPWISEHPAYWRLGNTPFEREARYELELRQPLGDRQVAELQAATRGGWPLGSPAFLSSLLPAAPRALQPRARGRPRHGG